ncbi:MAG: HAD family phosphatase [Bacteroidales bacterium]|nr:HAD family phosphatase [Bacteroidales bacterium]
MIRNIIFDFGAVLVDWDPHHLYVPYFQDADKAEWFLTEICPYSWNTLADGGRPLAEITEERVALFPEWEKEIRMYYGCWLDMMGEQIPGMEELIRDLKARGFGVYGLTNWSRETFPLVRERYPIFDLLDGYVVSGEEMTMKPDPALYRILLERYGLRGEECVFIDDNPRNAAGGESLGIRGIVFRDAGQARADLEKILAE